MQYHFQTKSDLGGKQLALWADVCPRPFSGHIVTQNLLQLMSVGPGSSPWEEGQQPALPQVGFQLPLGISGPRVVG